MLLNGGKVSTSPDCCCGGGGCDCPPPHPCSVSFTWTLNDPCTDTTIGGSVSNKQLEVAPADCGNVVGDFLTGCWFFSGTFPSCSIGFIHYLNWPTESFCETLNFQLIHYCGPWCEDKPTGWYLLVIANGDDVFGCCQFAGYDSTAACQGVYLGVDPFSSDFPFSIDFDGGGVYGTSYGNVSGTFNALCE